MAENPLASDLPADLPTDWAYGQIVAPTGQQAGLSAQHGYNYLMQQVNDAQRGVNTLGAAFENVPDLEDGKIPASQLPDLDYIPLSQKGQAGGVATLGNSGTVPRTQIPSLPYLPTDGGVMTGNIAMGGHKITGLGAPSASSDAARLQEVNSILSTVNGGWVKLASLTTAGSGQWTAPDLFGGEDYVIGVLVIGAGGGGGVAGAFSPGDGDGRAGASGGASGHCVYFVMRVSPGQKIPYVIGVGGLGHSVTVPTSLPRAIHTAGETGGSSSFAGVVAEGGGGGDAVADDGGSAGYLEGAVGGQDSDPDGDGLWGGVLVNPAEYDYLSNIEGWAPLECYDPFECRRILCSGASAPTSEHGTWTGGTDPVSAVVDTVPAHGGDAQGVDYQMDRGDYPTSAQAGPASGPGSGGGAASICLTYAESPYPTITATSTDGCDGAVIIYIQGRVTE